MAEPVQSKMWSTATLEDGARHVQQDQEPALLTEEEERLQRELEDVYITCSMLVQVPSQRCKVSCTTENSDP